MRRTKSRVTAKGVRWITLFQPPNYSGSLARPAVLCRAVAFPSFGHVVQDCRDTFDHHRRAGAIGPECGYRECLSTVFVTPEAITLSHPSQCRSRRFCGMMRSRL